MLLCLPFDRTDSVETRRIEPASFPCAIDGNDVSDMSVDERAFRAVDHAGGICGRVILYERDVFPSKTLEDHCQASEQVVWRRRAVS